MIKYFEWGRRGGCIVSDNRNEAYDKLNEKFFGNIYASEENETVAGLIRIRFSFHKEVEPSESTKKFLSETKE